MKIRFTIFLFKCTFKLLTVAAMFILMGFDSKNRGVK